MQEEKKVISLTREQCQRHAARDRKRDVINILKKLAAHQGKTPPNYVLMDRSFAEAVIETAESDPRIAFAAALRQHRDKDYIMESI